MANTVTSYFGERTTDIRLEALVKTQIEIVKELEITDARLAAAAEHALATTDAHMAVIIGQNKQLLSAMCDIRTILSRHYGPVRYR